MKQWMEERPEKCDLCKIPLEEVFYDGQVIFGFWCITCPFCFEEYGRGLGPGRGQKYDRHTLEKLDG